MTQLLAYTIEYLTDLDQELRTSALSSDPRARSQSRKAMRHMLTRVRDIIANLEQVDPTARSVHIIDKQERMIDLADVRIWCHVIEAKIMAYCYDDYAAGITWMQKALAIDLTRADNHALYAGLLSDNREHDEALAAINRAISLAPEEVGYLRMRDEIERSRIPTPDPTPDYPWWHVGRYLS
jgi:tetratricopeptide (TPR) repeat protein